MKVQIFDTNTGFYHFELDSVQSTFHLHPATEIIIAREGTFSITTTHKTSQSLRFAVIDAGVRHRLEAEKAQLTILMVEHQSLVVAECMRCCGLLLHNSLGCYTSEKDSEQWNTLMSKLKQSIRREAISRHYDERVRRVVEHIGSNHVEYHTMIPTLQELVHLSESRLSHLFKENVGVSLKKYLLWSKLKSVINLHLYQQEDVFSALIQSGFYDHAHFCRAFKMMLGVPPTFAYNSRSVQFFA
ncbi:MAG: AraC family transcriptional regulator [Candidatus Kapabacteria bacterium]|jgi:AraC-like DNA-binding protein|nr:AraC family transcriptional regulator [Candidatus Kapabacteria bacterium]